jgi:DNA-binding CsgD family transcriptional regulator
MTWEFRRAAAGEEPHRCAVRSGFEGEAMANTATSILWSSAPQPTTSRFRREPEWTFYSQVSVSGPTGFSTEHRRDTVATSGSLALHDSDTETEAEDDYRDPDKTAIEAERRDDDRQWGPWSLTQRELEVLQLLAEGATNNEISQRLYISPKTTKNHLAAIFQKLDVTNRTHALVRAVVMGLVTIE